jgi:hypothetical protein
MSELQIKTDPLPQPGGEKFADEPEDFGQVHKVFTQNLEWLETDVRGLKRHTWRVPASFGACTLALTLAVSGGLEIVNYSGAASDAPLMNWILFVAGAVISAVCFFFGCLALRDRNADVEKVADRVSELKY